MGGKGASGLRIMRNAWGCQHFLGFGKRWGWFGKWAAGAAGFRIPRNAWDSHHFDHWFCQEDQKESTVTIGFAMKHAKTTVIIRFVNQTTWESIVNIRSVMKYMGKVW